MSELINNSIVRKNTLKELIRQLHAGQAADKVRAQLEEALASIPYGEVVEAEQELIAEGISSEEIMQFCDLHSKVLHGKVDLTFAKIVPPGHPVDTFKQENKEIAKLCNQIKSELRNAEKVPDGEFEKYRLKLAGMFNALMDVDKHYKRKEYLLFPFLEKLGITGPPKVMWGKHDEIRDLLRGAIDVLKLNELTKEDFLPTIEIMLAPAVETTLDMITKEEEILFPMALDKLVELDWYEIYKQTLEFGFCLYDPQVEWRPKEITEAEKPAAASVTGGNAVQLPSGSLSPEEILAILNTVPFDMTFVDANDKVKYFTQGSERIFARNRAILNRDVRLCHPPGSVHVIDKILDDFKSGAQDSAPFWIQLHGKFIHIEYFALRDADGKYLGTLEVSQDLTAKRELTGEQRILSYGKEK
ncbi:MAG: DUF438 domain-containing protein [Chloroflexota bacterium]